MIQIRKADDRGHFDHGWLDTYHSFSFADYHDPQHMGFRALRVMNEDRVAPSRGFGMHPHRDMEIVTYILEGSLEHRDSMGNGSILRPGELQRMTAGTGILHSEYNPSSSESVHLYQIWLFPEKKGLTPGYEQRAFAESERQDTLRLVASRAGKDGSLTIHQDAELFLATLSAGKEVHHDLKPGRHAWLQVLRGTVNVNGQRLTSGDGAAITAENSLSVRSVDPTEILLFDLA